MRTSSSTKASIRSTRLPLSPLAPTTCRQARRRRGKRGGCRRAVMCAAVRGGGVWSGVEEGCCPGQAGRHAGRGWAGALRPPRRRTCGQHAEGQALGALLGAQASGTLSLCGSRLCLARALSMAPAAAPPQQQPPSTHPHTHLDVQHAAGRRRQPEVGHQRQRKLVGVDQQLARHHLDGCRGARGEGRAGGRRRVEGGEAGAGGGGAGRDVRLSWGGVRWSEGGLAAVVVGAAWWRGRAPRWSAPPPPPAAHTATHARTRRSKRTGTRARNNAAWESCAAAALPLCQAASTQGNRHKKQRPPPHTHIHTPPTHPPVATMVGMAGRAIRSQESPMRRSMSKWGVCGVRGWLWGGGRGCWRMSG